MFCDIQKFSMVDYPGSISATFFSSSCNLRCPYCHNKSLVLYPQKKLDEKEIISFLKKRKGLIEAICISGGEALIHDNITKYINIIKNEGYLVKLDTNGLFPDRLLNVIHLLDYVAMDVKNCEEKYSETSGVRCINIASIKESIEIIKSRAKDYEFRTTVCKRFHTIHDIEMICKKLIPNSKMYVIQNYIYSKNQIVDCDFMSFTNNELLDMKNIAIRYVNDCFIKNNNI